MSEELKICPFCGGKSQVIKGYRVNIKRPFYRAFCVSCQSRQFTRHRTRKASITAWNTRAGEKA
ncbi:Lar family restriction alleviation protein [Acetobacter okinawensis]|uniref:Lar family restriction alleviation protein n=1 Tax=Acetobacter okinawensis TaxID=1076594 RepID=UPI0009DD0265